MYTFQMPINDQPYLQQKTGSLMVYLKCLIFFSNLQTILLQDKEGENYCIACRELDTDTSKDDPGKLTSA